MILYTTSVNLDVVQRLSASANEYQLPVDDIDIDLDDSVE